VVARCISIIGVCADQPEKVGHSERAWHFGKIFRRGPTLGVHGGVVKHGVEKRADLAEHLGGVVGEFAVVGVRERGFLLASGGDAFAAPPPPPRGAGGGGGGGGGVPLSLDSGTDARGRLILLDMGMGKTAATLTAIARDPDMQPALILAPPRVARMTWPVEAAMWAPALRCGVAGGGPKQRAEVLHDPNLDLVCLSIRSAKDAIGARRWRTVVVDESTTVRTPSTKAHAAVRTLMRPQAGVRRLALLTGTPAPNCLSDLYGQVRLADSGERLGKSIASFRERWMYAADRLPSGVVTKWLERPGARDDVLDRIRDISLCVSYDDPAAPDLPERLDVPIDVELPTKAQLLYRRMEREGAIALREGVATAGGGGGGGGRAARGGGGGGGGGVPSQSDHGRCRL